MSRSPDCDEYGLAEPQVEHTLPPLSMPRLVKSAHDGPTDDDRRFVRCGLCDRPVRPTDWEAHVASPDHQANLADDALVSVTYTTSALNNGHVHREESAHAVPESQK